MKSCKRCKKNKLETDYYFSNGYFRLVCKACHIRYVNGHEEKRPRVQTDRAEYTRAYYQAHKEAFKQYRKTFKERHPGYHRDRKIGEL